MEPFWGSLVQSFGGEVVDVQAGATLIGSPEAAEAFQLVSDMWLTDGSMPTESQLEQYGRDGFWLAEAVMGGDDALARNRE